MRYGLGSLVRIDIDCAIQLRNVYQASKSTSHPKTMNCCTPTAQPKPPSCPWRSLILPGAHRASEDRGGVPPTQCGMRCDELVIRPSNPLRGKSPSSKSSIFRHVQPAVLDRVLKILNVPGTEDLPVMGKFKGSPKQEVMLAPKSHGMELLRAGPLCAPFVQAIEQLFSKFHMTSSAVVLRTTPAGGTTTSTKGTARRGLPRNAHQDGKMGTDPGSKLRVIATLNRHGSHDWVPHCRDGRACPSLNGSGRTFFVLQHLYQLEVKSAVFAIGDRQQMNSHSAFNFCTTWKALTLTTLPGSKQMIFF